MRCGWLVDVAVILYVSIRLKIKMEATETQASRDEADSILIAVLHAMMTSAPARNQEAGPVGGLPPQSQNPLSCQLLNFASPLYLIINGNTSVNESVKSGAWPGLTFMTRGRALPGLGPKLGNRFIFPVVWWNQQNPVLHHFSLCLNTQAEVESTEF